MAQYSVLIRNGLVFDGLGSDPKTADVGIVNDRIERVEDLSGSSGDEEIDAGGQYVCPGFVDLTNHSDTRLSIFSSSGLDSMLAQGVTSILVGNCGYSLAPIISGEDVENIEKISGRPEINIDWNSNSEFLGKMDRNGSAINFGTLTGHGTIRMASKINLSEKTPNEGVEKEKFLLEQALEEGSFGLSTSLGRPHGRHADRNELESLFRIVKAHNGLCTHHIEDEGDGAVFAVSKLLTLARETGVRTHLSHFKILGRKSWPSQDKVLEMIEEARSFGLNVTLDMFPYKSTGSDLYLLLPDWALEGSKEQILARLKDESARLNIKAGLKEKTLHYENIIIAHVFYDEIFARKSIKDISNSLQKDPEEIIIDLLVNNNLGVTIFNPVISEKNMEKLASLDYVAVASDGYGKTINESGAKFSHPRTFGAFPKFFDEFVKNKKTISWEKAIYKATGLPAKIANLKRRGSIQPGNFADLVIFDPKRIKSGANYLKPAVYPEGIGYVFVNGVPATKEGKISTTKSGFILRRL